MPYLGTPSLSHIHNIPASAEAAEPRQRTGESLYSSPLLAKIFVKSLNKAQTYYTFNSFSPPSQNGVIYCNVNLSLSHHGQFEFQIDDNEKSLDTTNLRAGNRVEIYMGKSDTQYWKLLSGMIRQTGYTRGCEQNLLYNIAGFGTGIRLNERILDVLRDNPKLDDDGATVDITNSEYFANTVVDDALDRASYYPTNITSAKMEGTGGLAYINSSGDLDSIIRDFIPGVVLRYGEIADLYNQIENYTGGRIYVDVDDKIRLEPLKAPGTANSGFMITTNPDLARDFGDTAIYVDSDDYTFNDSISKDAGYANSLYGILAATVAPDEDTSTLSTFFENKTVEIAQRFRPITQPNWRFYCGVEGVGLTNTQSENSVRGRWRICEDDNGVPKNTNGIIENRYMYPNKHYRTSDGGLQVIQISKDNPSTDLDENTWYWLILSSVNATSTEYWRWYYDDTRGATHATAAPGTSSQDDGGTGWSIDIGKRLLFEQGRFKAEPFNCLDALSEKRRILIETVVPNFPHQINSKLGAIKYLLGLIHNMGRPRKIFDFPSCTVPNKPVHPGDVCCIVDSRFNFSTAGNTVISGQVTDINHTMGIRNGGLSTSSAGQFSMSLQVVAYPTGY